jgi:hypothetical protein
LLHIKEVRKQEMDKVKMDKNSAEHYRSSILFFSGVEARTIITINVPVVYMARDVMILMQGWTLKSRLYTK